MSSLVRLGIEPVASCLQVKRVNHSIRAAPLAVSLLVFNTNLCYRLHMEESKHTFYIFRYLLYYLYLHNIITVFTTLEVITEEGKSKCFRVQRVFLYKESDKVCTSHQCILCLKGVD